MNEQLQEFARAKLVEGLAKLPESNQMLFKRMYSHKKLSADIKDVVSAMPEDKLDYAMQQVQHTLDKASHV